MSRYAVRGTAGATSATIGTAGVLWNPHASRRIQLFAAGIWWPNDFQNPAGRLIIGRVDVRGTAGSTITPDGDNAFDPTSGAPPSGAVLDLGLHTVAPSYLLPLLHTGYVAGTSNANAFGFWHPFPFGIVIPPGQGVAIGQFSAESMATGPDVEFEFED